MLTPLKLWPILYSFATSNIQWKSIFWPHLNFSPQRFIASAPSFFSFEIPSPKIGHCTVLHCTVRHCTVLHCTVLHCTALTSDVVSTCNVISTCNVVSTCNIVSTCNVVSTCNFVIWWLSFLQCWWPFLISKFSPVLVFFVVAIFGDSSKFSSKLVNHSTVTC